MTPARRAAPSACTHCGADVSPRALACPACGADADTGWSDDPDDGGGTPEGYGYDDDLDDEAYQDFLRREGLVDDERPLSERLAERRTAIVAGLLAVLALLYFVLR